MKQTNSIIYSALENGPWSWQSTQFYTESVKGYNDYYRFCDYIEVLERLLSLKENSTDSCLECLAKLHEPSYPRSQRRWHDESH